LRLLDGPHLRPVHAFEQVTLHFPRHLNDALRSEHLVP
jgi:hypothetical protein